MIDAKAAAAMLGISTRMLYDLAAPNGPIPCTRYSAKCVRFNPDDVKAYAASCRCEPCGPVKEAGQARLPSVKLQASPGESELMKLFRRDGITPKPRPKIK